ncbi:hypothetical protein SAMN02745883_01729 [Caminicella sporogenes DSM 14501]|uniref:Uncharacterized protein n=1 Tax=Caminicella sporogenes DSM 14501 TaxID=1121266 RepID=A0A1M6R7Y6_9FIRM|nr:hypothetical protein [Caminicella sporogenes]WIF94228.1 hypothetical protein QNI18_07915 [Caminicella sporogenes]SHK28579.1 hypothetical protein SAMN02745883_01729 [Caminicella sporogenes DSM 14501]
MKQDLIDLIEEFINLCNKLHREGKIDDDLYVKMTKNKVDFLYKINEVG